MKKTLKLIFLASYIFVSTTNANTELENTTPETDDNLLKLSAQQKYYLNNKWDFIENKLIENPNNKIRSGSFFIEGLLLSTLTGVLSAMATPILIDDPDAPFCIGVITGIFSLPLTLYLLNKKINNDSIRNFIRKYHPDLTKKFPNNNKFYTPEELHELFDELYKNHLSKGDSYLIKKGEKIIELIKKKNNWIKIDRGNPGKELLTKGLAKVTNKALGAVISSAISRK